MTNSKELSFVHHFLMLVYLIIGSNIFFMNNNTHIAIILFTAIVYAVHDVFGYKKWHAIMFNIVMVFLAIRTIMAYIYSI